MEVDNQNSSPNYKNPYTQSRVLFPLSKKTRIRTYSIGLHQYKCQLYPKAQVKLPEWKYASQLQDSIDSQLQAAQVWNHSVLIVQLHHIASSLAMADWQRGMNNAIYSAFNIHSRKRMRRYYQLTVLVYNLVVLYISYWFNYNIAAPALVIVDFFGQQRNRKQTCSGSCATCSWWWCCCCFCFWKAWDQHLQLW